MDAIRQLRAEVAEDPKAAMRHLKDGVENKVFDILLKRRSSAASSPLTSVSSGTTSFSSSSSSSRSGESGAVDEQVDEKSAAAGDVYVNVNEQVDDGIVYLDKNEVDNLVGPSRDEHDETTAADVDLEESDEEVVELEFDTAVQTMHTHDGYSMYCPNCSSQITRVVLGQKIRRTQLQQPPALPSLGVTEDEVPGPTQPPEHLIDVHTPGVTSSPSAVAQPLLVLPDSRSPRSVEIVKSIVYGGLMESMASLSVVSSAAASDSTTLNIVVLGLANLVGGLIVLLHNLKELRYGESDQTDEEIEIRYKKELGKRQHFPLHVFLAVISYFIFGLLPPAIYGSTFRETNDRDYKMLAVAGASLLSVFLLAIGKAYARGERSFTGYLKTVSYYISSAVMVAGISFAVGELAEKFVQQIGWLEPQAPAQVSGIQFQPSWASSY